MATAVGPCRLVALSLPQILLRVCLFGVFLRRNSFLGLMEHFSLNGI